jgi:hypothetical protein
VNGSETGGNYSTPTDGPHQPLNGIARTLKRLTLTKELLGGTGRLDDLDQTRSESLDGRNVVGKDTHVTGSGGDVAKGQMPIY